MEKCARMLKRIRYGLLTVIVLVNAGSCQAAISWGPPVEGGNDYEILFDRFNVVNPVYEFENDPIHGDLTVSFGTHFRGQQLGTSYNSLKQTAPGGPLRFASGEPDVMTQFDYRRADTIRLGGVLGKARYTTPISILFDNPVSQIGFTLGFLDELPPSTLIEAYEASGASLGAVGGLPGGFTNMNIVESGGDRISGISIYLRDGNLDEEGFGIDGVRFSTGGVVPEPATFAIWSLMGLAAFSAAWYSSRSKN